MVLRNSGLEVNENGLSIEAVSKSFDGVNWILRDLDLFVRPGEIVSLVGKSGAGKSTLMRLIAGLDQPDQGVLRINGFPITGPHMRLGYLVQDYSQSLFPWLRIGQNLSLGVQRSGLSRNQIREKVAKMLAEVDLAGTEGLFPWELSGGMQQRAALARALLRKPGLLLLDEPFASVDALVRMELEDLTLRLVRAHDITCILVTHDIDEAIYMADRVAVMANPPGRVVSEIETLLGLSRHQIDTKSSKEFGRLREKVFSTLGWP